ncbi:uncharacterized protein LOC132304040 [Cornus florida]|uniref:uncharacterized protein LOC132304040 n=1 Tax=Cornus florida TaxID=4283 RepID=UPI0028A02A51|nr:uncharacterized protein LOC132304040 [Cornus florida]
MSVCDEYYEWKWNAINLRKNYNLSCSNDNYLSQQDSCNTYNEISDACCFDHGVNKQYASPMPWIGIYVAAASLVCSLTMAANVFHGFSHRKLWFPCRFFTLNAAYLTLLGVAMKLPVDLSAGMPTPVDQLAKLTSTTFMCTVIGEEELPLQIMKNNWDATDHFIQKGEKRRPKFLKELLDKSTSFMGVARFDSDKVSSVYFVEFPNCWSLAVVTLTSIAIALPNIKDDKVKWLIRSVSEGLVYAKLVEKFLNVRSDMVNIRNAADSVWLGVDVFRMWLNEDLRKIAREGINSAETLKKLADIAKNMNGDPKEDPLNWPINLIAANSMYRISQTVLQDHEDWTHQTDETAMTSILLQAHEGSNETLFEQLSIMIADILCACLTNLPRVINMKFFCCGVEKRENSVLHAAQLIGEMEEILKILQERKLPSLDTADKLAYIDEWRDYVKANPVAFTSLNNDGTSSSGSAVLVKCRRLA